jgi:hypothetical protein
MPLSGYGGLDALGLADLVRRREVTPAELPDEAIARAESVRLAASMSLDPPSVRGIVTW